MLCATVAICTAGCAQVGHKFDTAVIAELQPGLSTETDAIRLLGPPMTKSIRTDGAHALQWAYGASGAFGAGANAANAIILFDADGKMIRVAAVAKL